MTGASDAKMRYSHVAIGCTDFERSLRFYEALGFKVHLRRIERTALMDGAQSTPQGATDRHVAYMQAGSGSETQFLALCYRAGLTGTPVKLDDIGLNHFSVWVEDLDTVLAGLEAAGGKRLMEPFVAEGAGWTLPNDFQVRSVFVEDPDGILVQLDQPLPGIDCISDGLLHQG